MRLTNNEIHSICNTAQKYYGIDCLVQLFGSRTSDEAKGGDIDLLIQSKDKATLNLRNKINFLVALKQQIGDQRIDVVYDNASTQAKVAFYQAIQQNCVLLNG